MPPSASQTSAAHHHSPSQKRRSHDHAQQETPQKRSPRKEKKRKKKATYFDKGKAQIFEEHLKRCRLSYPEPEDETAIIKICRQASLSTACLHGIQDLLRKRKKNDSTNIQSVTKDWLEKVPGPSQDYDFTPLTPSTTVTSQAQQPYRHGAPHGESLVSSRIPPLFTLAGVTSIDDSQADHFDFNGRNPSIPRTEDNEWFGSPGPEDCSFPRNSVPRNIDTRTAEDDLYKTPPPGEQFLQRDVNQPYNLHTDNDNIFNFPLPEDYLSQRNHPSIPPSDDGYGMPPRESYLFPSSAGNTIRQEEANSASSAPVPPYNSALKEEEVKRRIDVTQKFFDYVGRACGLHLKQIPTYVDWDMQVLGNIVEAFEDKEYTEKCKATAQEAASKGAERLAAAAAEELALARQKRRETRRKKPRLKLELGWLTENAKSLGTPRLKVCPPPKPLPRCKRSSISKRRSQPSAGPPRRSPRFRYSLPPAPS